MKRLHVLAALLAALTCSGLEAQTMLTATVPFDFQVGATTMPAGEYRIEYSDRLLTMRSQTGNHGLHTLMLPSDRQGTAQNWILEFRCYGNARFFAGIWAPNRRTGGGLLKSSREKEIASRAGAPPPTQLALNAK